MFPALIEKLMRREDLTTEEASRAMAEVMEGRAADAQIAGFLIGLAMKGERPTEIVGLARTMRAHSVPMARRYQQAFDCCGTGGDRSGTFNISSCVAVVVAACGVQVAKHGNRSVSSLSGSADVFEALGVRVTASPAVVERCLAEANIGFFFAPTFHPSMKHAGGARRALGVRTAFNLLGPLTNPAGATRQLVGVPRPEFTELLARTLMLLGSERAWVVHGADGIDEISTTGYTKISECRDGAVNTFYLHPGDVGLSKATLAALKGGDARQNAQMIDDVLRGSTGASRDVVLLNAGAALFIAGAVSSIQDGIRRSAQAIDSGDARRTLQQLAAVSTLDEAPGATSGKPGSAPAAGVTGSGA
jgi:anthranilate phosphoribosyltransferase